MPRWPFLFAYSIQVLKHLLFLFIIHLTSKLHLQGYVTGGGKSFTAKSKPDHKVKKSLEASDPLFPFSPFPPSLKGKKAGGKRRRTKEPSNFFNYDLMARAFSSPSFFRTVHVPPPPPYREREVKGGNRPGGWIALLVVKVIAAKSRISYTTTTTHPATR